jgi:hypothetical protein
LNEILVSSGYATSVDGDIVTGIRGGTEVEMLCCETPDCDVLGFLGREGDAHKIVASLIDIDPDVMMEIQGRATIWTRGMIEHEIGRVHIQKIIGEKEPGLLDELESRASPDHQTEEPKEHLVRPFVTSADVKEIGSKTVGGFRYRLELVPHHLFRYETAVRIDGVECGKVKGQIAINALTGVMAEWPIDSETVKSIDEAHRVLEPSVEREESRAVARKGIVALHTAERDVVMEAHGAVITERKKVMPTEADVLMEDMGLFFLPIWLVEGLRGVLIINAATGKIVSEDLYSKDLA